MSDTPTNRWAHLEDRGVPKGTAPGGTTDPAEGSSDHPLQALIDTYAERGADFPQSTVSLVLSGTLGRRESPFENYVVPAETMLEWIREPPEGMVVKPYHPHQQPAGRGGHREGEDPFRVTMVVRDHTFRWMLNQVGRFYFTFVTSSETDWVGVLKRGTPEELLARIDRVKEVNRELQELGTSPLWTGRWHEVWTKGSELLLEALLNEHRLATKARAMLWIERWVFNTDPQQSQGGRRPRSWVDHITCTLHDALRPQFDLGWTEHAGTPVPQTLRDHISCIMRTAGFDSTEADPDPGGRIDQALGDHLT